MTKTLPARKCKHCQGYFTPKRVDQKYCNDTCREAYYEEHYFEKTVTTKTCPRCGIEFPTTKPIRQVYCTPECRDNPIEPKGIPDKPEACELCDKTGLILSWHSQNGNMKIGLHLCRKCQVFVDKYNQGLGERYKELIEQGVNRT